MSNRQLDITSVYRGSIFSGVPFVSWAAGWPWWSPLPLSSRGSMVSTQTWRTFFPRRSQRSRFSYWTLGGEKWQFMTHIIVQLHEGKVHIWSVNYWLEYSWVMMSPLHVSNYVYVMLLYQKLTHVFSFIVNVELEICGTISPHKVLVQGFNTVKLTESRNTVKQSESVFFFFNSFFLLNCDLRLYSCVIYHQNDTSLCG